MKAQLPALKNPRNIKVNKFLEDFFNKIFTVEYSERLTTQKIKKHPIFEEHFPQISSTMLEDIVESGNSSIFISKFNNFPFAYELHKEEILIDFIENCSVVLDLDTVNILN